MSTKTESMMVRLSRTEADKVRHIAQLEDRSNSQVIRRLITPPLKKYPDPQLDQLSKST